MKNKMIFIIPIILAVSCKRNDFDWNDAVNKLTENGYLICKHDDTEEELIDINRIFLSEIQFENYELFDFKILENIVFTNDSTFNNTNANFVRFENDNQAKLSYKYFLDTRTENSRWKYQLINNIVISTNDNNVVSLLSLNVK